MDFAPLHNWKVTPAEAVELQKQLADQVILQDCLTGQPALVAGADVSYRWHGEQFYAAVVVLSLPDLQPVAEATARGRVTFPYVPGLLSFRELPVLLKAFEELSVSPDLVLVDGQGIAHPRRLGLASHLGLWLGLPTIGCAKSRLCGEHASVGQRRGQQVPLYDKQEQVGVVLTTRDRVKPLYISPGHKIGLRRAVEQVLMCGGGYRLPEPTRQAHLLSNRLRQEVEEG
ncbi:MAG: deoxyribonuclease V [Desulfuromonas sp.]|nr:MAG: deoxyribonuclease V [Desulfuromonas sp.]